MGVQLLVQSLILGIVLFICLYLLIITLLTFYFARKPRSIYQATPTRGNVEDYQILSKGKKIEVWVVKNKIPTENTVILTHAWGRDRGRMVCRSEKWYDMGFNTIILSARDHGHSERMFSGMHIMRFKEDVETVINWWNKPVVLHGHSIGGGASILNITHPLVRGVVAEAPPRVILSGLKEFYKGFAPIIRSILYPGTKLVFRLLYFNYSADEFNPIMVAVKSTKPLMVLYAKNDEVFNDIDRMVNEWSKLSNCRVEIFDSGGHSTISKQPNYFQVLQEFVTTNLTRHARSSPPSGGGSSLDTQ